MKKAVFRQTVFLLFAAFLMSGLLMLSPMRAYAEDETGSRIIEVGDYEVFVPGSSESNTVYRIDHIDFATELAHIIDFSDGKEQIRGEFTLSEKGSAVFEITVSRKHIDTVQFILCRDDGSKLLETIREPQKETGTAPYRIESKMETGDYYLDIILSSEADLSELQDVTVYVNYKTSFTPDFSVSPTYADKNGWIRINEKWYYFENGQPVTGWKYLGGKWYYLDSAGVMLTGWRDIDGKRYFFASANGDMVTGWQRIGIYWYCFHSSGYMQTGWLCDSGKWYYLDESGRMVFGLQTIGGRRYYFNGSGQMVTGWQTAGVSWYYFGSSGQAVTGWQYVGGKWYLFASDGKMLTGWQYTGGKWYYMDSSGAMTTGWKYLDGRWYYLDSSGAMVTGTKYIGSTLYTFDSSGVWIG